jgi:predicted ArsR family transcriptional regulator
MSRKTGLYIKKAILTLLKEKEYSIKQLEMKTNTGYLPIKKHCEELAFLKIIELKTYKANKRNGRPYTTARLTDLGRKII